MGNPSEPLVQGESGSKCAQKPLRHTKGVLSTVVCNNYAETLRILPVIFAVLLALVIYTVFVGFHCLRLLNVDMEWGESGQHSFVRGLLELIAFHILFTLFCISYILVVITSPGTIPNTEDWTKLSRIQHLQLQKKLEGTPRYCKWCDKYKPDRAHHCRQCRQCVLKMDHHCPWIYNCVGWANHKYFLLTLLYASLSCVFVSIAQLDSVLLSIKQSNVRFEVLLLFLFSEIISSIVGIFSFGFLCFHMFLIFNNMSNIEFCEKRCRGGDKEKNIFNLGVSSNLKDALGPCWLLRLFPIDNRPGDGVTFPTQHTQSILLPTKEESVSITAPSTPNTQS